MTIDAILAKDSLPCEVIMVGGVICAAGGYFTVGCEALGLVGVCVDSPDDWARAAMLPFGSDFEWAVMAGDSVWVRGVAMAITLLAEYDVVAVSILYIL